MVVDPLTAYSLTLETVGICMKVAKLIKSTIEAIKNARKELLDLFQEVENTRAILDLLRIMSQQLEGTSFKDMQLALHPDILRATLDDVQSLVSSIAGVIHNSKLLAGLQWNTSKAKAVYLTGEMRKRKGEVLEVVTIINTTASLRTLQLQEDELKKRADSEQMDVVEAFEEVKFADDIPQIVTTGGSYTTVQTWLGYTTSEQHDEEYLRKRNQLADAAYAGNFDAVFELIEYGRSRYGESWANATRIKPRAQISEMSYWTPLHQAVYMNAPTHVIEKLVNLGAFRTLRTRRPPSVGSSYVDQTALELAQGWKRNRLIPLLTPIIYSTVPSPVLSRLQTHFHHLIVHHLGNHVEDEYIRLPVLKVLTELDGKPMWFPVKSQGRSHTGYLYRLDDRELVVQALNIHDKQSVRQYRITTSGTSKIDEAYLTKQ